MGTEITIKVSDEQLVDEIAYGIIGRAQDIHENPDNEYEWVAEELKEVGDEMLGGE
jgi:hypothetical protein